MDTVDKAIDAAKTLAKQVPTFGVMRLKDLIRAVRNAKTLADERAVIAKESAHIRTSFKEENVELRAINVAKLLYIHMLGYPAHFGQMDCLKLVASPRFADKRLGYLGIMLLLDENQEVLTLVTNSIQNDLRHANQYIVGLALATLANISSQEMCRDLVDEVLKLLGSTNPYVRKKAALCALRIVRKVPDLIEEIEEKVIVLLGEKNHGVLLTGFTLASLVAEMDSAWLATHKKELTTAAVRHLKNLVSAGFSPEHDVSGICDPFLQVKILRIMRILGRNDKDTSEAMNDVLAQVATNTDSGKNVGHAILYEAVLTIMDIESESSLRVLAINILGKFLANKDNNIRYVALNTLCRTCAQPSGSSDSNALQRHRAMVLECLRDADISIRRRALDLSFHLVNAQNIRLMVRELLLYLEFCEGDVKESVSDRIISAAASYRPNKRWEIDTMARILLVAGSSVNQNAVNAFVKMVTTAEPLLQAYTVSKLYWLVDKDRETGLCQEGLSMSLMWVLGEFGNTLLQNTSNFDSLFSSEEAEEKKRELNFNADAKRVSEQDVVNLIGTSLKSSNVSVLSKAYALTALLKLDTKISGSQALAASRRLVESFRGSCVLELQNRSLEYSAVARLDESLRQTLVATIPPLDLAVREERIKTQNQGAVATGASTSLLSGAGGRKVDNTTSLLGGLNDELLGLSLGTPVSASNTHSGAHYTGSQASKASNQPVDLLADLFGETPSAANGNGGGVSQVDKINNVMNLFDMPIPAAESVAAATPTAQPKVDLLADLFSASKANAPITAPVSSAPVSSVPVDPFASLTSTIIPAKPSTPLASAAGARTNSDASSSADNAPSLSTSNFMDSNATVPSMPAMPAIFNTTAYDKNGLYIAFKSHRDVTSTARAVKTDVEYRNTGVASIEGINFQVAVPKVMQLSLQAPSTVTLNLGATAHQSMRIENPTGAPLKLRIKISFTVNGQPYNEVVDFTSFDPSLWQ